MCDVLTKQWLFYNYFKGTITIVLASQQQHRMVSDIPGLFLWRAILKIIAQENHIKYDIALCFQSVQKLDVT